jgi:hypothetical protein
VIAIGGVLLLMEVLYSAPELLSLEMFCSRLIGVAQVLSGNLPGAAVLMALDVTI